MFYLMCSAMVDAHLKVMFALVVAVEIAQISV